MKQEAHDHGFVLQAEDTGKNIFSLLTAGPVQVNFPKLREKGIQITFLNISIFRPIKLIQQGFTYMF